MSTFERALTSRGLTRARIADHLLREMGVAADATVFAYGSLVDGVGNAGSDLDLCLVADLDDVEISPRDNRAFVLSGTSCDLMVVSRHALRIAVRRLRAQIADPIDVRRAALGLDYPARRMLHALLHAESILGIAPLETPGCDLQVEELACHTVARSRYWIGNLQADLAGMASSGDAASMVLCAQDVLLQACDAILARFGRTNPNPKWRMRQLDAVGAASFGRTEAWSAAAALLALHRGPARVDLGSVVRFARRAVDFARRGLLFAEEGGVPASALFVDRFRSRFPLALDVAVFAAADELMLSRLRDGATFKLGREWLDDLLSIGSDVDRTEKSARLAGELRRAGLLTIDDGSEERLALLLQRYQNSPRHASVSSALRPQSM